MNKSFIIEAKRTAVGNFCGSLSRVKPQDYSSFLIKNILSKYDTNIHANISRVIIGQVLGTSLGQNPARQVVVNSGLNIEVPAYLVNQLCGSGLKSIILADKELHEDELIFAGGQENMSMSPHYIQLRNLNPKKLGDVTLTDSLLSDGLTDAFFDYHMGMTAENLVKKYDISRDEQDEFSYHSQRKASLADKSGRFKDEIIPFEIKNERTGEIIYFESDEFIKHDSSVEKLSKLKPAFSKENGSVTAGNSSGINDGAAILLMASEAAVKKHNLKPIAQIISYADVGVAPEIMGIGPVEACKKALQKASWTINDLDLIELNEAFAVQALAVSKEMNWDMDKVNVNGGALALGHPIGASGARCLTTLIHEMRRRRDKKGLVSLCIGGGMGIAMCIECLY